MRPRIYQNVEETLQGQEELPKQYCSIWYLRALHLDDSCNQQTKDISEEEATHVEQ
jgi:hypothetical protein